MKAFGVAIDTTLTSSEGEAESVAAFADRVLNLFAATFESTHTDLSGSAASGEYSYVVIVHADEADAAAVMAADKLREVAAASAGGQLRVRGVRVREIAST